MEAEEKILKNPYVYNDHVNLLSVLQWVFDDSNRAVLWNIEILRWNIFFSSKLGDISRLRKAYERLGGMCPIAPSQWLQRLQSEVKNSSNLSDRNQIHKLFKQAFTDCYCKYTIYIYIRDCILVWVNQFVLFQYSCTFIYWVVRHESQQWKRRKRYPRHTERSSSFGRVGSDRRRDVVGYG